MKQNRQKSRLATHAIVIAIETDGHYDDGEMTIIDQDGTTTVTYRGDTVMTVTDRPIQYVPGEWANRLLDTMN